MTAKDILKNLKAIFEAPAAPVVPPAPEVPAPVGITHKLADGTEVSIIQAGELPAAGDAVTVGGVPAPAGELAMEDGSTIVVGEGGVITEVKPAEPVTTDATQQQPAPVVLTAEAVHSMYAKFATGTPEERIANLELMVKALMECNFGYQIRQGQENAAIQAYKDSLATTQTAVAEQTTHLQAATQKIEKQDEVIKGLFELAEKLAETPTADPKTLTGNKKEQFERTTAKEKKIQGIAEAITQMKKQ
jgi:hypothetical protein